MTGLAEVCVQSLWRDTVLLKKKFMLKHKMTCILVKSGFNFLR